MNGRASVLGVTMPMYHATGVMARARTTLALIGVTTVTYTILLVVVLAEALDGADYDVLYWLIPPLSQVIGHRPHCSHQHDYHHQLVSLMLTTSRTW